jgi:hypothetical protein
MPTEVYPNPTAVTVGEVYRNLLADQGVPLTSVDIASGMDSILHALDHALYRHNLSVYGDGSDGTLTFISTGSTTVAGATLSNGVYTMTRDIYAATATVNTGVTINTAGYRFFCSGLLTLVGTANINNNGTAASGNTGGAALSATVVGGGTAGGNGATGNGSAGASGPSNAVGGNGGAGGNGNTGSGGAGATVTVPTAAHGGWRNLPVVLNAIQIAGATVTALSGGAGGGGGSGDGTNLSGGGGGGGGICLVAACRIVGGGSITANGGAGGAGAGGNAGGGAGGGGGGVFLISRSCYPQQINNQASNYLVSGLTTSVTAAGGAGGAGVGSGNNGSAGNNGTVLLLSA